ncbi:large-conductance mechanosensitive channel protein MscL [Galbibacter sp. EGI 63066]|uniref:large-conductance mechanosensitive channel protein MscL n=1 Tax=Galbibacter sp. EGI 63066 TaxID=2993559 RepID=UPI0022497774|nr:large-conductance mechanosensitive channel protein MscL [Galbibacter sp. EGI 63066]MCX2678961.1 large-conductance mechanosensitive channel protein MscL [Galbibacter sp. EGI 63066]
MGFFKDFKSFLLKGDIVNLATAVIIAGAFGKIVASFTKDIIMPPIGILLGDVDFADLKYVLKDAVVENSETVTEAVSINYGLFITSIIDFVIIGFFIFLVLRAYEKSKKKKEEAPAPPPGPTQEELLAEIRDELKKQNK